MRKLGISLLGATFFAGFLGSLLLTCPGQAVDAGLLKYARRQGRSQGLHLAAASPAPIHAAAADEALFFAKGSPIGGYSQLWPRRAREAGRAFAGVLLLRTKQRSCALVELDAVTFPPALWRALRSRLDASWRLHTLASHTHSGPGGLGSHALERFFLGPADLDRREQLADELAALVSRAEAQLQPVQVLDGWTERPELVRNRSDSGASIDSSLDVLALLGGSQLVARLVTFTAHPTLVADRHILDGDYPAALRRELLRHDTSPLLFGIGPSGSASASRSADGRHVEHLAQALADAVDTQVPLVARSAALALACERDELMLPRPRAPLWSGLALRPWLTEKMIEADPRVDLLRLGPVLLVTLPGELSAELSADLRRRYRQRGLHLILAAHNGNYLGYFMPAARYGQPGPERLLELYGPGAGELVVAYLDGVLAGMRPAGKPAQTGAGK